MKNLIRVGIVGLVLLASLLPCLTISPSVSATGNISYGMWDFLSSPTTGNVNASCVNWFCASNFDWIVYPYGTNGTPSIMADTLYAAGKDIILRTWFLDDINISIGHKTWTDLKTNSSLYNSALATIENQINTVGESYLYAVTINEEEPDDGYWGGAVNVSDFITVHNHMYADLKLEYPTLRKPS